MTKKNKKRKLNKKRVYFTLLILFFFCLLLYKIFTVNIANIYISGNEYFSDQEIIDMAGIKDYPKSINNLSTKIKKRLETSDYILSSKVRKSNFLSEVDIKIEENYPLFYYEPEAKYVLYDGKKVEQKFTCPTIINQIPNTVYDKFIKKYKKVDIDILNRISEIKYEPNEVDDERFLLFMNDGNYVYLTISRFLSINKYLDMINSFDNKKGILHLDSGEYFDLFD